MPLSVKALVDSFGRNLSEAITDCESLALVLNATTSEMPAEYTGLPRGEVYDMSCVDPRFNLTEEDFAPLPLDPAIMATFMVLYGLIIVLGIAGNTLVLVTLSSLWQHFGVTEVFILSLTISDLLVVVLNIPFQLVYYLSPSWTLGDAGCKLTNYMQGVTIVASILTLSVIAIDRYLLTCHALYTRGIHRTRNAVICVVVTWSITLGVCSPQLWLQRLHVLVTCQPVMNIVLVCWEIPANSGINLRLYTIGTYLAYFIGPLLLMLFAYGSIVRRLWCRAPIGDVRQATSPCSSHQKRRLARMLIVIMTAFFFCWLPFFTVNLFTIILERHIARIVHMALKLLGYCNSVVNPIIYALLHKKYRSQMQLLGHSCQKMIVPPKTS